MPVYIKYIVHSPGDVKCVSPVVVVHTVRVTDAEVAHRVRHHNVLHDTSAQVPHHCKADYGLSKQVFYLTVHKQQQQPQKQMKTRRIDRLRSDLKPSGI